MKMQKIEVEIPILDGWEFDGYRKLNITSDAKCVYMEINDYSAVKCADSLDVNSKKKYLFYKKKPPRKIIYEEVREDYLKRGDLYLDDNGDVNEWVFREQSRDKNIILAKIHDEFEVNNG